MRKIFYLLTASICIQVHAQKNMADHIIEGGRVMVDLLKVLRSPKNQAALPRNIITDSCEVKQTGNICYRNTSGTSVCISLFLRSGNEYSVQGLSLKILKNQKECLYDLPAGIYKYRIATGDCGEKNILKEGEIRILPCDNRVEEIKEN